MKTNILLALVAIFQWINPAQGQSIQLKPTVLSKYSYLTYIGKDQQYYYYHSGESQFTKFKIGKPSEFKDIKYKLPDMNLGYSTKYFQNDQFFIVKSNSVRKEEEKMKKTTYNFYKMDTETGAILKQVVFEVNDSANIYYSHKIDTAVSKFFVTRGDSVVKAYNYELEEIKDYTEGVFRPKPSLSYGVSDLLKQLMKSFNLSFTFTISETDQKQNDSLSMEFYKVAFQRRKDEDIYHFKSVIQGIVIGTKLKDNKVKSVDFGIDVDKSVIDLNYREDNTGKLFLFGKYVVKGNSQSQYGMFSVIYDKSLNQVSSIKYFDLNTIENFTDQVPNKKYVGFIFNKLSNPDYEFYFEDDNIFAFTYQQSYTNLQDHIYLLKVESNGEITVHMIVNRLFQKTKSGYNEKHMAVRSGNRIHFIFYDHKDDVNREISDLDYTNGSIDKKTCVLLTCSYNVLEDEFTKKTLIADKKSLKVLPHLDNPIIVYDARLNQNICLVKGLNKKRDATMFYEFIYVD